MVDNITWTDLAQVDAVLTAELLDNGNVQTHKIPSVGPTDCESKLESLMRQKILEFSRKFRSPTCEKIIFKRRCPYKFRRICQERIYF